jgi:hypothetical protein
MQREVRSFESALPVPLARTMEQLLEGRLSIWKRASAVPGILASWRSAPRPGKIVWLVMRDATILVGAGIPSQARLGGRHDSRPIGHPREGSGAYPATILLVVAILAATGVAAAYFPAQRAGKADPSRSLHHDWSLARDQPQLPTAIERLCVLLTPPRLNVRGTESPAAIAGTTTLNW